MVEKKPISKKLKSKSALIKRPASSPLTRSAKKIIKPNEAITVSLEKGQKMEEDSTLPTTPYNNNKVTTNMFSSLASTETEDEEEEISDLEARLSRARAQLAEKRRKKKELAEKEQLMIRQQKQKKQQQCAQQNPSQQEGCPSKQSTQEPQQEQRAAKRKAKMPPINITDMDCNELVSLCKLSIGEDFSIKRLTGNRFAIQTNSVEEFEKMKNVLKRATAEFYTYTPKAVKNITVLLKGVDPETEPEVLLQTLRELKCNDLEFIAVKPFNTARARRENRKLPFYLVQLGPSSKIGGLRKITILNHQIVTWDKLKKGRDILQCLRCQRFGHSAANCEMQYRCVKCGQDHSAEQCTLGKERVDDKSLLKCAVCKNEGHPANYRGCPKFRELQEKKFSQQRKIERPIVQARPALNVTPQFSYAQVTAGRRNTSQPTTRVPPQHTVPPETVTLADVLKALVSIQTEMTQMHKHMKEQDTRLDWVYSQLSSQPSI